MCATCKSLRSELYSPGITAAQADRLKTLIRSCELRTANPLPEGPVQVISNELLDLIADAPDAKTAHLR